MENSNESKNALEKGPGIVRVWCDGCYDMTHFGHANSLRQAKDLGNEVFVGVHSDEEIKKHKACPPVLLEQERYEMVRAIKWVDHVIEDAPYMTSVEILDEYNCDFCAHGDDKSTNVNGEDTYQKVKDAKRYQMYKRTQGISTTQLINRMLKFGAEHYSSCGDNNCKDVTGDHNHQECQGQHENFGDTTGELQPSYTGNKLPFLPTAAVSAAFAEGLKDAKEGAKIVYAPGTFDLLHPGHLSFLEKSREEGDHLIVGLYSDETVKKYKGHYPIMNLDERYHSLMAIRIVSNVVIKVPYVITKELLEHFNIQVVAYGKRSHPDDSLPDPYAALRETVTFAEINSNCNLRTKELIKRVCDKRKVYEERNANKEKKEASILQGLKKAEDKDLTDKDLLIC